MSLTLNKPKLAKLVKDLKLNPKQSPFSNKTDWPLRKVYEEDHTLLEANFRAYINGFSKNVDDILEHFNYRQTISQMVKNNQLSPILNQYKGLELGQEKLSGLEMGYIYEELRRRFSEQSGEEAGEHFTPREVIRLMVELLDTPIPDRHVSIYDPACGTGGMLSVAKEHLLDRAATPAERDNVDMYVTVHGQELSPTNYAICQANLLIKNDQQAKVYLGNSLIPHEANSKEPGDQLPENKFRFDFLLSNPPFGVTWGGKDGYEKEARKLEKTRYQAGMPRVNDGALLFLQTMLAKMQPPEKGGGRIAIIFNGSPLSNGDCGQGAFLTAFLSSPLGQAQVLSSFTGASRQGLSHKELGFIRIPFPTINVQNATYASLSYKLAEVKRIAGGIEPQIATLTAYRKSLIHECLTGQRRITEADLRAITERTAVASAADSTAELTHA